MLSVNNFSSILLVDDDEVNNFHNNYLLREVMDFQGNINVYENGQDALDFLESKKSNNSSKPELILLDIQMPEMNGFEFLKAYQEMDDVQKKKTVICMLSSSLNDEVRSKAEKIDEISGLMDKPLNQKKLLSFISNNLD